MVAMTTVRCSTKRCPQSYYITDCYGNFSNLPCYSESGKSCTDGCYDNRAMSNENVILELVAMETSSTSADRQPPTAIITRRETEHVHVPGMKTH